jgi:hypothetical protein
VLKRYDHRIYLSPRSKIPKHSASLQNIYFHLNVDCVRKKNPQFEFRNIVIHNEIKQHLSPEHRLLLGENENKLSMSTSDSNIDSVSYRILVDMFNDASQILGKKDNIIKSPGCTDTFYVADNKSRKPKVYSVIISFQH